MSAGGNLDSRLLRFRASGGDDAPGLAEALLDVDRASDALDVTTAALKREPSNGELQLVDGRARFAQGDLLGAQAVLLKAARALPKDKRPFRYLGEVLLARGDSARAKKVLQRALSLAPNDPDIRALAEGRTPAPPAVKAPPRRPAAPAPEPPQERTVMRTDLTEQLRNMTREVDAAEADDSDFEDEPTAIARAGDVAKLAPSGGASTGAGSARGRLGQRGVKRTLALGSAKASPALPPPPSRRPALDAPSDPFAGGLPPADPPPADPPSEATAVEPLPPPPAPPRMKVARTATFGSPANKPEPPAPKRPPLRSRGARIKRTEAFGSVDSDSLDVPLSSADPRPSPTSTSPGAAAAPPVEPLKRVPPSARRKPSAARSDTFEPSEKDIDDAFGALEAKDPAGGHPSPFDLPPDDAPAPNPFAAPQPDIPATAVVEAVPEPAPPPSMEGPDPFASGVVGLDELEAEDAAGLGMAPLAPVDLPPPAPAASVAVGGGDVEDVDAVLHMLREQGLFEPPTGKAGTWATRKEVKKSERGGTRIGIWMGVLWTLSLGLAVGGWFGWGAWLEHKHAQAAELVAQSEAEALAGSHADLVDAERHLREARELDPHETDGPRVLLFVHAQRALEDGAFDAGFMRPTIARAELFTRAGQSSSPFDAIRPGGTREVSTEALEVYLDAARAVLSAAEGSHAQALERARGALEERPEDPQILYIVGRLEQRLGGDDALTHLEAATEGEGAVTAARIALAEARYDEGQLEAAQEMVTGVLEDDDDHLRAKLWSLFLRSDADEPEALLTELAALGDSIEDEAAPTDHVLEQLLRARLSRRQGNIDASGTAVEQALRAGATEPRLMALVAAEGRRAGRLLHAERAARTAVTGAPSNPDFRKLLAGLQLLRHDGRGALATISELPNDDPDVVQMRAEAAMLLGTAESLEAAATQLDAYVEANEDANVEVRALRIRVHTRRGDAAGMLSVARALVTEAPGDPAAALALGETALRLRRADMAVESLQQVVTASPDSAEGHYLLGRARRLAGDGEGAEASLRRALELVPEHTEARLSLGRLLLDSGQFEEADELYAALARSARSTGGRAVTVAGRLGRAEALLGQGELDDAQVQLESLQEDARETASARLVAAQIALQRGQAGEALTQLRPLATAERPSALVLALYGDALLSAGQAEPAAEAFEAAIEADSGSPEALIGQADLAVRSEREDDAVGLLERVATSLETRIRPPRFEARRLTLLGRAQLLAREREAARDALRAAIELDGTPSEAHFFLGEALSGENSPGARAAYEQYLELAEDGPFAGRARRAIR
ncbi:MAG: tetratricopeptide repeat protein [Sandaracinaceae bacterium]